MDTHLLESADVAAGAADRHQAGARPNLQGAAIESTDLISITNRGREGKKLRVDPGPFVIRRLG